MNVEEFKSCIESAGDEEEIEACVADVKEKETIGEMRSTLKEFGKELPMLDAKEKINTIMGSEVPLSAKVRKMENEIGSSARTLAKLKRGELLEEE